MSNTENKLSFYQVVSIANNVTDQGNYTISSIRTIIADIVKNIKVTTKITPIQLSAVLQAILFYVRVSTVYSEPEYIAIMFLGEELWTSKESMYTSSKLKDAISFTQMVIERRILSAVSKVGEQLIAVTS